MTDRTATRLLLIARNRATGRLTNPGALDIGLRAGMLTDLLLSGHIVGDGRGPRTANESSTGDRLLDAVRNTVTARPNVAWRRWFRHVRVDRDACVAELIQQDRWQAFGRMVPTYLDLDPAVADALRAHTIEVIAQRSAPDDSHDATLALIAAIAGATGEPRRRAKALRGELAPLLDSLHTYGDRVGDDLAQCLTAAARSTKRDLLPRRS